ncbi:MAG: T9SS type A sorting domain-containing protein [Bacteroidota bacterium]|nr:T9SS type A sorting domain-containing protein [Bacteroidota bacterium]
MKPLVIILNLYFIFSISNSVKGQSFPNLEKWSLTEINGQVKIDIKLSSGNICYGIDVYRSIDSNNFVYIGGIPGFCGSLAEPTNYEFVDEKPVVNSNNYYYIDFGGLGTSPILNIVINKINTNGYRISPNPSSEFANIYFLNDNLNEFEFVLINNIGGIILKQNTNTAFITINVNDLLSGIYSFSLINKSIPQIINGSILVMH